MTHAAVTQASIMECYENIEALSFQMLSRAQDGQWDELLELGDLYRSAVEALKKFEPLDKKQKLARREILTRILENDALIRALIEPEMERLSQLLGQYKRQRSVLDTYFSTLRSD